MRKSITHCIQQWWVDKKESISESVSFEGRRDHDYVLQAVADADFAFLLRPSEERYAQAGFPTKVAESCSCGTAMLCNYSSDLELYLHDGENSIIVSGCNVDACQTALNKILKMQPEQIIQMKENARKTAEASFDLQQYIKVFSILVD